MKRLEEIKEKIGNDLNLEMLSSREAYITGNVGIELLSENEIAVSIGKTVVSFFGQNLQIDYYNEEGIRITGKFEKTEFTCREI